MADIRAELPLEREPPTASRRPLPPRRHRPPAAPTRPSVAYGRSRDPSWSRSWAAGSAYSPRTSRRSRGSSSGSRSPPQCGQRAGRLCPSAPPDGLSAPPSASLVMMGSGVRVPASAWLLSSGPAVRATFAALTCPGGSSSDGAVQAHCGTARIGASGRKSGGSRPEAGSRRIKPLQMRDCAGSIGVPR